MLKGMHILNGVAAAIVGAVWLFSLVEAHSTQRNPLRRISVVDEPILHTPSHRVHALSSFDITFTLQDSQQHIRLTASPNHDVIAEDATVQYLAPDGSIRSTEVIDRLDHKVFMGSAWLQHEEGAEWTNVGWARILVHRDGSNPLFEGAFRIDGDHNHIQTRRNYLNAKLPEDPQLEQDGEEYMIVWRDSDIVPDMPTELRRDIDEGASCPAHTLSFNRREDHPVYTAMLKREKVEEASGLWGSLSIKSLLGRQIDGQTSGNGAGVNLSSTIGDTAGCPNARKVALIGVATDCTYTASFNSTSSARANIIAQINSASVQYENSFNISLGLKNITISDATCPTTVQPSTPWNVPCSSSVSISDRLNSFSGWRGNQSDSNAWWTLLSTCNTGSAIGLSWLGQACVTGSSSSDNETVASANVVVRTSQEWQVIAHESGHSLGAVHDCTSTTCSDGTTVKAQQCCPFSTSVCDAGGQFIMNPSSGSGITKFSACSIGNICSALGRGGVKSSCLVANKDVSIITASQCGNGIVEAGEECDCGGVSGCGNDTCCVPTTCKFTAGSQCDASNEECCTSTCQFATAGTVCRASSGVCDPQEICSGNNATCPPNTNAPDGTSCGNSSSLACASGQCTSRDLQCKTLMGSYTQGNDTYACDSTNCQISCASPEFPADTCYSMNQNFLDGTPCGGGGSCSNGVCQGSTVGGEISSWIQSNKTLVIALSCGIGGLILLSILICCVSRFRHRRRVKNMPRPRPGRSVRPRNPPAWAESIPRPPPMRSASRWGRDPNRAPPPYFNGPSVRYA